ncbi:MAG: MobF family relaxase, partial [Candidatus Pelagibacter ubique]
MLSITNVSVGQASNYYHEGKDNYYLKSEGQWFGKGASELGLSGTVEKEDFERVLHGQSPQGEELIRDGANGTHRAGIDMTFSAPKSVSILYGLGDEKTRAEIMSAHEQAVKATMQYVETNFAQARVKENGVTDRVTTGNLVVAMFHHTVSRELDPQMHTHCVVMNMTQRGP